MKKIKGLKQINQKSSKPIIQNKYILVHRETFSNQPEASNDDCESTGSMPKPSKIPHDKKDTLQPIQVPLTMEEAKLHSAPGSDSEVDLDPDGSMKGPSSKATKEGSQFKPTTEDELKAVADQLNAIQMNPEFSEYNSL